MKDKVVKFYNDHQTAVEWCSVGFISGVLLTTVRANKIINGQMIDDVAFWNEFEDNAVIAIKHNNGSGTIFQFVKN